ncbi:dTMP kinase [Synchytrium endobioticum]|uniref:Thymidylate kinase n=1 Tax=Synchytrium endobioticum TaxID=286115 RepID=A0A507CMU8_9FUNG|nr:dTMP kinase [Synchytrium endobioticum]TPX40213.1 dTMP kinase [Synchytrium endobioticum]
MGSLRRGAFVVFEGCDRTGKSTQATACLQRLQTSGVDAHLVRYPDRTTHTGALLDRYLRRETEMDDRAVHLLFSANRWESMDAVRRMMQAGTTVLADRYAYSGAAYSCAKGLDLAWCKGPDRGLVRPDAVIFLQASARAAAGRDGYGTERYETPELQERVRTVFGALVEPSWKILDAAAPVDVLADQVYAIVSDAVGRVRELPIQDTLWL